MIEDGKVTITASGKTFTIDGSTVKTDMDIITTGDVIAGGVSLKGHVHGGVSTGSSATTVAV